MAFGWLTVSAIVVLIAAIIVSALFSRAPCLLHWLTRFAQHGGCMCRIVSIIRHN
jgi:hypothetical protein